MRSEPWVFDRVNMYQPRAPSFRFFLANGWESTNLKERNQTVRDLGWDKSHPLQQQERCPSPCGMYFGAFDVHSGFFRSL
jgi:hypothetical protein